MFNFLKKIKSKQVFISDIYIFDTKLQIEIKMRSMKPLKDQSLAILIPMLINNHYVAVCKKPNHTAD